jgi:hypothetical protein
MNRIRSLANSPRLDRQENPNNARVKKKTPYQRVVLVSRKHTKDNGLTQPVLEPSDIITVLEWSRRGCGKQNLNVRDVVEEKSANHYVDVNNTLRKL